MSTRNPQKWTEIGETVSNWQDILTRLYLGRKHQERLQYAENALKQVAHCYDMAPPQTLGELCLELAHEDLAVYQRARDCGFGLYPAPEPRVRGDIQRLKTALYHTHRDQKMCCYHERLDKLIDKVKDAWSPPIAGKTGETKEPQ
jgi:hypothetical protein